MGGKGEREGEKRGAMPRLNFRPLVFCAAGLICGLFVYARIRFGGVRASDFLFFALLLGAAAFPLRPRRLLALAACFFLFAGVGAGCMHAAASRFGRGAETGRYAVCATVTEVTQGNGYCVALLGDLSFDGESYGGTLRVSISSETVRAGDRLEFTATVRRVSMPSAGDGYAEYLFSEDIRYTANVSEAEATGTVFDPFLRLRAALYDTLHDNMEGEEAGVCYALLSGSVGSMDDGLSERVRTGGIAHVFAVSGLHIGILYGAVMLCLKPLGRWRTLPALALALCYCAFCGFAVSAVRALVMCAVLGVNRMLGRKTDFLQSLSLAAVLTLLIWPAQWFSAGFRLSFGACLGLGLLSGCFGRGLRRLHLPRGLADLLAASFSAQIVTLPISLEAFGYVSVWGFALNLIVVPLLPVLFLGLLACSALALVVAPAAAFFLAIPAGMVSAFVYLFALFDVSFVLAGFSLGAGGVVLLTGAVALSERVRMRTIARAGLALLLCVLFALCLFLRNAVPRGCKVVVYGRGEGRALLVRTPAACVLVLGEDMTLSACEDLLARNYGGTLSAAVVLGEDEAALLNVAAFVGAEAVYAREETETGLRETAVYFGEAFSVGSLSFRYESATKLAVFAEGCVIEADFSGEEALGADLFLEKDSAGLIFYLKNGIIKAL